MERMGRAGGIEAEVCLLGGTGQGLRRQSSDSIKSIVPHLSQLSPSLSLTLNVSIYI